MSVIGSKLGTKSYSEAPQNEIAKNSGPSSLSISDQAKLGGDDIGETLNKIADPNWVDPNRKVRAVGNDKMDKEAFMKLMLAQMKHQDPTNPMQSHELAAQLAQFSSVEQLQNVNSTLTEMKNDQKPGESFQALNFIGKAVSGDSAKMIRTKGDKSHDISYNLPDDAVDAKFRIIDAAHETVRTINLKDLKKGEGKYTWNGQDEHGTVVPAGEYQMSIEATNAAGQKLNVKTDFDGVITGVNYTPEGPVLMIGNQTIKLKDVKKIVDPSLMKKGQAAKVSAGQDLKNQQVASDNNKKDDDKGAPDAASIPQSNLMSNVGMSRDMMSKLDKETKPDSQPPSTAR